MTGCARTGKNKYAKTCHKCTLCKGREMFEKLNNKQTSCRTATKKGRKASDSKNEGVKPVNES